MKKDGAVQPEYHVNDYLCSVRVVTDARGEVLERNDYSGFGKRLASSAGSANRYRFSGKEEQGFAGVPWQDFGARMYDPDLARWTTPDPLAEKYPGISPYVYCNSNPVNFVDPDGEAWETAWDVLNVVYDVGAAVYNHVTGDHGKARDKWKDAGYDALAAVIPGLPAGFSKLRHVDEAADAIGALAKAADNAGDLAKSTDALTPVARGRMNEARVLDEFGLSKNTKTVQGNTNTGELRSTIPDAITSDTVYEVKDVQKLSNTKQIQAQIEYAQKNGLNYKIITGTNTHVSGNIPNEYIIRLDYLGPQQ